MIVIPILDMTFEERLSHFFLWEIDAPLYSSLLVMFILLILGIVIGVKARIGLKKKTYLERPKGILLLAEIYEDYLEGFVGTNMGPGNRVWVGYFWTLFAYLFLGFIFSLTGLPSVIDWLAAPLSLSLIMFVLIQYLGLKYSKWGYFKRYVEPIPVFLPVNLITMWAPLLSTCMRMFGNALAGSIIIGLVQWALGNLSSNIFASFGVSGIIGSVDSYWSASPYWTGIFLAPIPMGVLNLYFGLFSGFIQTLVFSSLSALWFAQEKPIEISPAVAEAPRLSFEERNAVLLGQ